MGSVLLRYRSPLVAHRDISLWLAVQVAIGGTADMNGRVASGKSVETASPAALMYMV
jgi:hypothetical protein